MHEMSLTESMLQLIEEQARTHGFARVKTVWLEIGQFANVEPESMRFCFDVATRGTVADGAALEIIRVPGQAWCLDCAGPVALAERHDPCPACGGFATQVQGGDAMRIKELEVE